MLEVDTGADRSAGTSETTVGHRFFEPGLSLSVSDLTDSRGGYSCHLAEIDERALWIDLPIRRDGMLSLSVGQLVTARFDRPDDAVYVFDSVVSDRRDDDRAPFGLAVPVSLLRRPRRAHTRLSLVLDASLDAGEHRAADAKVVDLSAGGVKVICEHDLGLGDEVVVRCDVPGPNDVVPIEHAATVRTALLYGRTPGGATLRQYGLRFADADSEMRDRILDTIVWNTTNSPGAG